MSVRFDFVNCDRYRLACVIGATYAQTVTLQDKTTDKLLDIAGSTAEMLVLDEDGNTVVTPTVTVDDGQGTMTAHIAANVTADLAAGRYLYTWDRIDANGSRIRELDGIFEVVA
jgi:hypothetical protein